MTELNESFSKQKIFARLEWLSTILDSSIPLGKSGYRIGIDPLLGLIPGIGDSLSALAGSYIVIEAARLGASRLTLGRMMVNLGFDALVGGIPVLGDLFDFTFKANRRNLQLLRNSSLADSSHPEKRLSSAFFLTLCALLIFIATIFILVFYTTVKFFGWLMNH